MKISYLTTGIVATWLVYCAIPIIPISIFALGRSHSFSIIVGAFIAIILGGALYVICQGRVSCDICGWKILRNPKGMGPVGHRAHPNCERITGLSAWGTQIIRYPFTKSFRCINCGEIKIK